MFVTTFVTTHASPERERVAPNPFILIIIIISCVYKYMSVRVHHAAYEWTRERVPSLSLTDYPAREFHRRRRERADYSSF